MKPSVSRAFFFYGIPGAALLVGLTFAAIEVRGFLLSSSWFAVKKVEVSTKGPANDAGILRLASIPPEANIFSLDLDEVKKRVERDAWVKEATVSRALPNKIKIFYRPQEPVAILGAEGMYYLNSDGVPFYNLRKGDSLNYPLIQAEGFTKDTEDARAKIRTALDLLKVLRASSLYTDADLGDLTVQLGNDERMAPYLLTLKYPPKNLGKKWTGADRIYTLTVGEEEVGKQVGRWEVVVRHLVQQGKSPRLIRLELGKKVVVKLFR